MEKTKVYGRRALHDKEKQFIVKTILLFLKKGPPLLKREVADAVEILI